MRDQKVYAAMSRVQSAWRRKRSDAALGQRARNYCTTLSSLLQPETEPSRGAGGIDYDRNAEGIARQPLPLSFDGEPAALDIEATVSKNKCGSGPRRDGEAVGWTGWAGANPLVAAEVAREEERAHPDDVAPTTDTTAGYERRPWTAAAAVEDAEISMPTTHRSGSPPTGMMTVQVRIGKEETSLVTPIVVAENATNLIAEDDSDTRTSDNHGTITVTTEKKNGKNIRGSKDLSKELTHAAVIGGADDGMGVLGRVVAAPLRSTTHAKKNTRPYANTLPEARWARETRGTMASVTPSTGVLLRPESETARHMNWSSPTIDNDSNDGTASSDKRIGQVEMQVPLPVPYAEKGIGTGSSRGVTAAALAAKSLSSAYIPAATAETLAGGEGSKVVTRDVENFMEDTQVYLGCALCGVKYLVEAVDARLPESAEGVRVPVIFFLLHCFVHIDVVFLKVMLVVKLVLSRKRSSGKSMPFTACTA